MTRATGPAFHFAPDAYDLRNPAIVGRRVASEGFLRVAASMGGGPLIGYGDPGFKDRFAAAAAAIDPRLETRWIAADRLDELAAVGGLYRPDPRISGDARLRLRHGHTAYSICGVFHTTSEALPEIAATLREPLADWDAIVCPSTAVRETVRRVHEAEAEYLRWRLGPQIHLDGPRFPVIPLGVDCAAFETSAADRAAAREALGLGPDDVMALFVGRFSYVLKSHPLPMYAGLQEAARRTGRRVVLVQCGYFGDAATEKAFRTGADLTAPDVRCVFVDGRDEAARRRCWAAADLFVSLSDNIQETFGLTPIEAMAAGLPVVVSDWDGYRDTVRDGVDGFRIPTWAPGPGHGEAYARTREAGMMPGQMFAWATASATTVELPAAADRLTALVGDPDLRRRMGEAGRAHARANFDWSAVFRQYADLWRELAARREAAVRQDDAAPRRTGGQLEPFTAFGHYPTATIDARTRLRRAPDAGLDGYRRLAGHLLFPATQAREDRVVRLWPHLSEDRALSVPEAASAMGCNAATAVLVAATLAKMGLVRLENPPSEPQD
jgi:glycosyltransferase involved in cell wall biosynthesis